MISILSDINIYTILLQILIGFILPVFKSFILSESQFQESIKFLKDNKIENLCKSTLTLIENALNGNNSLRGNAGNSPDLVLIHVNNTLETCLEVIRLKKTYKRIEFLFTYLIITFGLGVLLLLLNFIIPSARNIFTVTSLSIVTTQIGVTLILRRFGIKLKKFENL